MSVVVLDDLPLDENGRPTRAAIARVLGVENWVAERRSFACVYSGGRKGSSPIFMQAATELGQRAEAKGWVIVNGSGTEGCMKAVTDPSSRSIGITTSLFAKGSTGGNGTNEGLSRTSLNVIVPDFFERKEIMERLSNAFFVLPGGYGSMDEAAETAIFAARKKRPVLFVNLDGYWNGMKAFFGKMADVGLMPEPYSRNLHFPETVREAVEIAQESFSSLSAPQQGGEKAQHPSISLRRFLIENPVAFKKLCQEVTRVSRGRPRVGVIASGNIGLQESRYNLSSASARDDLCKGASAVGSKLALHGAVAVLVGERAGLRERVASSHIFVGGHVIWVSRGAEASPLKIENPNDRETSIILPRHFEVDRMAGLLCQSMVGISGGIHTFDRVMGYVTRAQTGHGCFSDLFPECSQMDDPRPRVYLYDPVLGGTREHLWAPVRAQVETCVAGGFISERDRGILSFSTEPEELAERAVHVARLQPDLIARRLVL